jgi:hypothetical protein
MNKDVLQGVFVALLFAVVGVRLYNKYFKKSDGKIGEQKKPGSSFSSSSKDDDYEPYSKK